MIRHDLGMVTILEGDVLAGLATLPDGSVNCVVTSPPYWALRDYRVEGQIGLEASPYVYVSKIGDVFDEVRRVLRADGTCWVNMGDKYQTRRGGGVGWNCALNGGQDGHHESKRAAKLVPTFKGLAYKQLIGIPWLIALELQRRGWWLRRDIIWNKPTCPPETVKDRPTTSHEYVFLLSKSERYWFDAAAISEPTTGNAHSRGHGVNPKARKIPPSHWDTSKGGHRVLEHQTGSKVARNARSRQNASYSAAIREPVERRNARSVWTIASEPLRENHFAAFPRELARRCIVAGCPEGGLVLDPFLGSGRAAIAAVQAGRRAIGIEINPESVAIAKRTLAASVPLFTAKGAVS